MAGSALHLFVPLALSLLHTCAAQQPLFILTAPNVIRVESEENIVLEAHDFAGGVIDAEIRVLDFPAKRQTLYPTDGIDNKVQLSANNQYHVTKAIKISAKHFKSDSRTNQYIYLQATSANFNLEKEIVVSFHSGYVFVQTDKTIYTPTDNVLYRVFSMTHHLSPTTSAVSVEVMNPDGIIVSKDVLSSPHGISSGTYKMPEVVNVGIWKIVAKFEVTPQENYTSEFEVKEYVLPSFEVKLEPSQPFFYVDDNELSVDVTATYLYGNKVLGYGYIVFGVLADDEKRSFPDSLQRIEIEDGRGVARLTRQQILSAFPDINQLIDKSIYISATVLTSTGSDMVEAEKRGLKIVTTPYKVLFTKTPKYFKPGMPFDVMVLITNPDGSPARNVDVEGNPGKVPARTNSEGTAKMTINTIRDGRNLAITVRTKNPKITEPRQADGRMEAIPYKTPSNSNNYLHIGIQAAELLPGANLQINLNIQSNDIVTQDTIKYFSYLIINKGNLLKAGRQERLRGQSLVTMSLLVTREMIPSFRVVAYYYVTAGGKREIVSDSVWVDVKDSCMGTLQILPERGGQAYSPRKPFGFKIRGDPGAKVGLVAVDKAVFVLNNKNKLTQTKIWDHIEKNDIGCSPGSGANNMGVFKDAGLIFKSSIDIETESRNDPHCPVPPKRRRRSLVLVTEKTSLAGKYTDSLLKKCCMDGMSEIVMDFNCKQRSEYIVESKECIEAFLHCCIELTKKKGLLARQQEQILARSEEDDRFLNDDEIVSRTEFPESWLWQIESLPIGAGDKDGLVVKDMKSFLKDSITTWEILAISLSAKKGICVADPYEITVKKDFFIDLRLPYSVIRNEQVEIKAVLYNYYEEDIEVRVEWMPNSQLCSMANKNKYSEIVRINQLSSRAVPFIIIPMKLGKIDIEVKASGKAFGDFVADGVKKQLHVVPDGMQVKKMVRNIVLDPVKAGGVQNEFIPKVDVRSIVPDTEAQTFIAVTGNLLAETVESAISGSNLANLIRVPYGCGEQNMITMTPPVIATHYLDKTDQWEQVSLQRRAEAIKYIGQGYTQELAFRKTDNSYGAWITSPSSTWLTAYVAKVFAMAYSLISIDDKVLCGAVKWLILNKQQADGTFKEDAPVYHGEMVGGLRNSESDATLTAFVLIALAESQEICRTQVQSLEESVEKAASFLDRRLLTLQKPYTVAITSYALALCGRKHQDPILMRFASADKTNWDGGSRLFTLEATAYALLASVRIGQYDRSGDIVRWLTEQRFYGGGFESTQATIIVFQAMAEYMTAVPEYRDIDLDVELTVSGRSKPTKWKINKANAFLARSEKANIDKDISVSAKGTGQGAMSVMSIYYALVEQNKTECKKFELDVLMEEVPNAKKPEGAIRTFKLTARMTYQGERDATMSILDITMLTGFIADQADLGKLANGVDKYIQKFEVDKALSNKASLILYLDKVSNKRWDVISFKVHQMYEVGLIQPAGVTIYEYYEMDKRCQRFYHPDKESGLLSKICQEQVCRCAEENCSLLKKNELRLREEDRLTVACEAGVDYVYRTRLLETTQEAEYSFYKMEVVSVIKEGTDENPEGKRRVFISHSSCRKTLNLETNKEYLIMGKMEDLWQKGQEISYILGSETWIEWWPSNQECQDPKYKKTCRDIKGATDHLHDFGCPN
ncbi:complement C3-like [Erpetoichthys calabaricus]|uniref:complement C3-like n=1 Tax=Erpetoichthys calabaricus TaxID=27687 RepID=UPI002234449D|nr:complement C3-like [Erpetoichthys calabaricus]